MDAREKLNEFAELRGWDKNKLIGWSEAAGFGQWLVENCSMPDVSGSLHLVDFIEEIEYMQRLYSNAKYTQAEATRDKLAEQLDDLMRLG